MNFNLISPSDNGHEFNVRYNEPIVVPPNSSVQLNWAQFERDNTINFTEDQTFTYIFNKITPTVRYVENTVNGVNTDDLNFSIAKGKYTLQQLQDAITKAQLSKGNSKIFCGFNPNNRGINSIPEGALTNLNPDITCDQYEYVTPNPVSNGSSLQFGFIKKKNMSMQIHATPEGVKKIHAKNAEGFLIDGTVGNYYNATADGVGNINNFGNSYMVSRDRYFHLGYDIDTYNRVDSFGNRVNNGFFDEFRGANTIQFRLTQQPDLLNGRTFVGLWNEELGGVKYGTYGAYDQRNNDDSSATYHKDDVMVDDDYNPNGTAYTAPQSLGGICFEKERIVIVGDTYDKVEDCNGKGMVVFNKTYEEMGMNLIFAGGFNPTFGIQVYKPNMEVITTNGGNSDVANTLYVRCFYTDPSGTVKIFYDSDYTEALEQWTFSQTFQDQFKVASVLSLRESVEGTSNKNVGSHTGVPLQGALSGTGMIGSIVIDGGQEISGITVTTSGTGYVLGEQITIPNTNGVGGTADSVWVVSTLPENQTEAQRRSQMPFNVIMASTCGVTAKEGIANIAMDVINMDGNSLTNAAPAEDTYITDTMVENYTLNLTKQLGDLFEISNNGVTLDSRHPSRTTMRVEQAYHEPLISQPNSVVQTFYNFNTIIAQYRLDRFTVYLNELPIKVYQNTKDKSKSGSRRNILSNIPNPFSGASVFDEGAGNVIGSYVPSLGVSNFLGNQLITTNNFGITVRNMDDDTPATQLQRTVVNFTITPN